MRTVTHDTGGVLCCTSRTVTHTSSAFLRGLTLLCLRCCPRRVCVCMCVFVLLAYIRADEFKMLYVCVCVCVRSRHKDKLAVSNCCTVMNADPPLHRAVSASLDSLFSPCSQIPAQIGVSCHYVRRIRSVSLTPG